MSGTARVDDDGRLSRTTAWAQSVGTPLREFLRAETGGAAVLLAATVAALVWANVDLRSYEHVWGTELSIKLGSATLTDDLRHWVNDGLMAIFFLVVGLEARRELDMGELRERRRIALPACAALGGMAVPVAVFLAFNGGSSAAHGWGIAMSTDTAFAIGLLMLVGPRSSARLRALMVTLLVVDDLVALTVIATAYTSHLDLVPLLIALGLLAAVLAARWLSVRRWIVYAALGVALWVAVRASGIDPVIVGLAMGLLTYAYPAARSDLERATDLFRLFREQPTPELARAARGGVTSAISPNEQLQHRFHPWSSYVIVPLFALANAGIALDGGFVGHALGTPIVLGIVLGYVLGKPAGVLGAAWLGRRASGGRLRLPVGWGALAGGGATAGIGFTVALLIASRAFGGERLQEAKLGILLAAGCASLLSWAVFRAIGRLPLRRRLALLIGAAEEIEDLALPVDPEHDHVRGPQDAAVTLVEYGDFECPYCGRAEPVVRELLVDVGDLRYVWRHLPLTDVHPQGQLAAEAAEAAAAQGAFWELHALLFQHQDALRAPDLVRYAEQLGLDAEHFAHSLHKHAGAGRVARDVESADLSGVSGTPTFFINGRRHHGAYDIETLTAAVKAAKARVLAGR
jgi:Na+/H+ antiporter NhaA